MEEVMLMTPEELFEEMKKMKVGQVLDLAQNMDRCDVVNNIATGYCEGWYGITRIDLGIFNDEGAFVLECYGGGDGKIVTYRDDPDDAEYALMNLKTYLDDAELLQSDGRVAVECKKVYIINIKDGSKCE